MKAALINRYSSLCIILLALLFTSTSSYSYSCYRHIYNHSTTPWTFHVTNNSGGGNVYFLSTGCSKNGPCRIPPKTTVEIQYTEPGGIASISGRMHITDHNGKTAYFNYSSDAIGQCPDISHDGDTGSVSVNDPASGDYSIWAPTW